MSDFSDRVKQIKQAQEATARRQREVQAAQEAERKKTLELDRLAQEQLRADFAQRIRNSPAYKTAYAEAHSTSMKEAFQYLHDVMRRTRQNKVEKRGFWGTTTQYQTELIPFEYGIQEFVEYSVVVSEPAIHYHQQGITIVVEIPYLGSLREIVWPKGGGSIKPQAVMSFYIDKKNLELQRFSVFSKFPGNPCNDNGFALYEPIRICFVDHNEILDYLAEIAAKY